MWAQMPDPLAGGGMPQQAPPYLHAQGQQQAVGQQQMGGHQPVHQPADNLGGYDQFGAAGLGLGTGADDRSVGGGGGGMQPHAGGGGAGGFEDDDDGADIWAALGEAHMEFQQDVPVGTTASTFQLPTGIGGGSIW